MKKLLSLTILLFVCVCSYAQNGVFVFNHESDTLCFPTNKIVSMSLNIENENQIITCVDTVFSLPVTEIDSICFVKSDDCVKFYDSEKKQETYVGKDGTFLNVLYNEREEPLSLQMILPNNDLESYFCNLQFDKNQRPVNIQINDNLIELYWINENQCDIKFIFADSIAYTVYNQELVLPNEAKSTRKASGFGQTWQKWLGGTLQLVGGALSTVGGAVDICEGVGTIPATLGASILQISSGALTVHGGIESMNSGFIRVAHPELADATNDNWKKTALLQGVSESSSVLQLCMKYGLEDNFQDTFLKKYLTQSPLGRIGFILTIHGDILSNFGESYQWYDHYRYIMEDGELKKVVTGIVKDIEANCATIRGYVSPDIQKSPFDGTRFDTEYGIVVRAVNDPNDHHTYTVKNGDAGSFEHTFTDLNPDTEYSYVVYFNDKSNHIFRFGEFKKFKTKVAPIVEVSITNFIVTKSQYKEGGFTNDGEKYDFRFDATVTVELYANDYSFVEKWGYVYEDPKGKKVEIPLSGTSAIDSRYAYFRNSAHSTARLYGFAYVVGMEQPIYGEVHDFPLDHAMAVANTGECVEVKTKSATVNCSYENVPQGAKCGVEYRYEDNWLKHESNSSEGTQTITLNGLQSGTKYYYRAYIDDNGQMYYGGEKEFTTEYEIPDITGTWSCNIYKDDGSILNSLNITLTNDGKATQVGSDRIPENTIGGWSVSVDGKVGVNFSWDGVRWTWFGEQFSGQLNSLTNPSQIEGTVWRGYATEITEGGSSYRFVMTR